MNKWLFGLFSLVMVLIVGCAGVRPIIPGEVTATLNNVVVYTDVPVRRGEVYFPGLPQRPAEVDLYLNGRYIGTARSGQTLWNVMVPQEGQYTITGDVYSMQGWARLDRVGCVHVSFQVSSWMRTSLTTGHWWRVDAVPSPHC